MHMEFTFKNFEPSEHLKKYARRRLEKAGRFWASLPRWTWWSFITLDKHRSSGGSETERRRAELLRVRAV